MVMDQIVCDKAEFHIVDPKDLPINSIYSSDTDNASHVPHILMCGTCYNALKGREGLCCVCSGSLKSTRKKKKKIPKGFNFVDYMWWEKERKHGTRTSHGFVPSLNTTHVCNEKCQSQLKMAISHQCC